MITRRNFIKNTGFVAVSFSLLPEIIFSSTNPCVGEVEMKDPRVKDWLHVLEDGRVKIFTGKMELGQGIRIAIAQVAAEELNMNIDQIEVHLAETKITPDEGYTAGSRSIVQSAMTVRKAAAAAANILLQTASEKYAIQKDELSIKEGKVYIKNRDRSFSFSEILEGKQIESHIPSEVKTKPKSEYQFVGTPVHRKDLKKIIAGAPVYVHDLNFPNMLHARVVRPPAYKAVLREFNPENAEKLKSVVKIFKMNGFIGVLATQQYAAQQAKEMLEADCKWNVPNKSPQPDSWKTYVKSISKKSENVKDSGNLMLKNSVKASYSKPYLMHAAVGPSCAVAFFDGEKLKIWTHSQGVYPLEGAIADLLNLTEDNLHVKGVPGSGCYGHNGADDVAAEAAILALAEQGKHIRLQWSRHDEHGWEPYGSSMLMELEGSLDEQGMINSWKYELWSDTHSTRPGSKKANLLPTNYYQKTDLKQPEGYLGGAYRNADPYYEIKNKKIDANFFQGPLRVSALRSLGAYANIFAIESFMDELAEKAGIDAVEFRLKHLKDPRAISVLKKLKQLSSIENPEKNEGIGYAFSRYKNTDSYFAAAVKIHRETNGKLKIKNMWGVIDSGEVINPDGLRNQTEGGMLQSASWTMIEEVKYDEKHVSSLDWISYPIFKMSDSPLVKVEIIDQPYEPPLGAGEAAQGATSAAIVNAIYNLTGKRVRDLPVSKNFSV